MKQLELTLYPGNMVEEFEVRTKLGFSPRTMQRYRKNGLPFTRVGKRIFYHYDDIERIFSGD